MTDEIKDEQADALQDTSARLKAMPFQTSALDVVMAYRLVTANACGCQNCESFLNEVKPQVKQIIDMLEPIDSDRVAKSIENAEKYRRGALQRAAAMVKSLNGKAG